MTVASGTPTVFVDTAARLHFGVLDLRGSLGRWFGGVGAAAPAPTLRLSACPADSLIVDGEDAERAATFARRFLEHHGLTRGVKIRVERSLPPHAGLGSGTQLGLAVGRALAEVFTLPTDAPDSTLGGSPMDDSQERSRSALPRPDRPAIAVLPFLNMSGEPEQDYFSDGISEDIVTALSKRMPSARCWRGCRSRPPGGRSSPCRMSRRG